MFTRVQAAALTGVQVASVWVEADVSDGLPTFSMVGYLSSEVREAQDRVRTALRNLGIAMPPKKITINLAPTDIRKEGARYDLPIAAAILAAGNYIPENSLKETMILGELGLDGQVRHITGVLPSVIHAKESGCRICIVPMDNLREASVVKEMLVVGVAHLEQMIEFFRSGEIPDRKEEISEKAEDEKLDFSDICGQEAVKRAAMIAVSGFHNLLLIGPPGSGKSMLARRIPTLLPELTEEECMEISKIYSVAGLLPEDSGLIHNRPFRAPHHTATPQALAGGGKIPKPGEITLAHKGILFLDELPEFSKRSLEILRQPLEEHKICISRSNATYEFPAHFLLTAAMNPCPCGFYPDMNRCACSATEVIHYRNRISQPLLDRMDVCVEAPAVSYLELKGQKNSSLSSKEIRNTVKRVQNIQRQRYSKLPISFNSELSSKYVETYCVLDRDAGKVMQKAFEKLQLSARGYHRLLKVARTIADMEEETLIRQRHIQEAICYRSLDKKYWK